MIAARQIAFGGSKRKPYDAEIEYLESTGTQYIDTGYTGLQCPWFGVDIQLLTTNVDAKYLGAYPKGYGICQLQGKWRWSDGGWTLTSVVVDTSRFVNVKRIAEGWFIDGVPTKNGADNSPSHTYPVFLFVLNYGNTVNPSAPARIKRVSFFDKDFNLVLDLTPVRVGDVGYMYDKVSGKLFGNAGTGAFVLGSDI